MQVVGLFLKPVSDRSILPQSQLDLQQGYGIQHDRHAQVGSPRQVLILDLPTLNVFGLQPGDLQENILLSHGLASLRSGLGLYIGDVLLRVTYRCEPCAYLETLQPGLTRRIGKQRGWLGMVITSGTIAIGVPVRLTPEICFPPLADAASSRFAEFVATIPAGTIVTTRHLITALGVTSAYYRAIPGLIKRASPHLAVHRIVAIDGGLLTKHLPHQASQLAAEGIEITSNIVPARYVWQPENYWRSQNYPIEQDI